MGRIIFNIVKILLCTITIVPIIAVIMFSKDYDEFLDTLWP